MSARILLAIPSPAASSAARVMRKPLDSLAIDWSTADWVISRLRPALIAETFVLIRMGHSSLNVDVVLERPCSSAESVDSRHTFRFGAAEKILSRGSGGRG